MTMKNKEIVNISSNLQDKFISIFWTVGTICNYKCSYCGDDRTKPFKDFEGFFEFTNAVSKKYPEKEILLNLLGGEVTLWKKFNQFLMKCNENSIKVNLLTNGSPSVEWWEENIDKLHYVLVSYHHEYASKNHFKKIAPIIRDKATILLMLPHNKFDEVINFGKQLSDECKICVDPKYLLDRVTEKLYSYTNDQLDIFKNNAVFGFQYFNGYKNKIFTEKSNGDIVRVTTKDIFLNEYNKFKGWKCFGGLQSFTINYDGNIFVGGCGRGNIGNIYKQNIKLPSKPYICDIDSCNCSADFIISRKENGDQ
ncbi:MAG: hypothetical protein ACTSX1_13810 [Candidatus Heimdallarchaeaceae archaeon]